MFSFKIIFTTFLIIMSFPEILSAQNIKKDGVVYIQNKEEGLWQNSGKINLEKVLTIGGKETDKDEFIFGRIDDMQVDSNGNIFLCDAINHCIKIYDKDGLYLKTIGKQGSGPGEFNLPQKLGLCPNGDIVVCERGNRRISIFNSDGDYVSGFSFGFSITDMLVDWTNKSIYFTRFYVSYGAKPNPLKLIYQYDLTGKLIDSFDEPYLIGKTSIGEDYSSGVLAKSPNNLLVSFFFYPYEVRMFDKTNLLVKVIQRSSPLFEKPVMFDDGRYQQFVNRASISEYFTLPDGNILLQIKDRGKNIVDELKKSIDAIKVGKRYEIPTIFSYDLFDSEGHFLQSFADPLNGGTIQFIDSEGFAYVRGSKNDIPMIEKYRILVERKE